MCRQITRHTQCGCLQTEKPNLELSHHPSAGEGETISGKKTNHMV